jgi:hypothetical protein
MNDVRNVHQAPPMPVPQLVHCSNIALASLVQDPEKKAAGLEVEQSRPAGEGCGGSASWQPLQATINGRR